MSLPWQIQNSLEDQHELEQEEILSKEWTKEQIKIAKEGGRAFSKAAELFREEVKKYEPRNEGSG